MWYFIWPVQLYFQNDRPHVYAAVEDAGAQVFVGRYTHSDNLRIRLGFLHFLLSDGQLWLMAPQVQFYFLLLYLSIFSVLNSQFWTWRHCRQMSYGIPLLFDLYLNMSVHVASNYLIQCRNRKISTQKLLISFSRVKFLFLKMLKF